jgi:hypothetical protein
MNIETLRTFFMWCTVIDGGILILWTGLCMFAPELLYRVQKRWFPLPRETYDVAMYSFLGLFKIFVLVFNAVPFVALLIVA